jgi:hypothetical protein
VKPPASWADINLDGDPILVVGRRPGPKALEGFVVDLQVDTFGIIRDIARSTIEEITRCEPVDWHPNAEIEEGEQYLTVNVEGLPSPPRARNSAGGDEALNEPTALPTDPHLREAAALLRLVLVPGELNNLHPAHLDDSDFRFYAVVWEEGDAGQPVAFVSEYNPVMVLRKANSWFRFDGTLRLAAPPDFALDDRGDLIVTGEEIAVLRPAAFDHLFSDIRALLNDVPENIIGLQKAFTRLPISDESQKSVEAVCATRPTFARRLQELAMSSHAAEITPARLNAALRRHGEEPTDFIRNGRVEITRAEVGPFLDVLEGRWYEADFTSEPRRAARWTQRKSRRAQQPKRER